MNAGLFELLLSDGCSREFAEIAMGYEHLFMGHIESFIQRVEELERQKAHEAEELLGCGPLTSDEIDRPVNPTGIPITAPAGQAWWSLFNKGKNRS